MSDKTHDNHEIKDGDTIYAIIAFDKIITKTKSMITAYGTYLKYEDNNIVNMFYNSGFYITQINQFHNNCHINNHIPIFKEQRNAFLYMEKIKFKNILYL